MEEEKGIAKQKVEIGDAKRRREQKWSGREKKEWRRGGMGMKHPFKMVLAELSRDLTLIDSVDRIPTINRIGQHFEKL